MSTVVLDLRSLVLCPLGMKLVNNGCCKLPACSILCYKRCPFAIDLYSIAFEATADSNCIWAQRYVRWAFDAAFYALLTSAGEPKQVSEHEKCRHADVSPAALHWFQLTIEHIDCSKQLLIVRRVLCMLKCISDGYDPRAHCPRKVHCCVLVPPVVHNTSQREACELTRGSPSHCFREDYIPG